MQVSVAKVFVGGIIFKAFEMTSGVRQGHSLFTVLFNLTLHEAVKELGPGVTIVYKSSLC